MTTTPAASLPPATRLSQMIVGLWVPQAVHAAAELGLADVLAEAPLSSRAVAERLGTHPDATDRLMRGLVILGVVVIEHGGTAPHPPPTPPPLRRSDSGSAASLEQSEPLYALTEMGRCLQSDSASSRRAWSRLMGGRDVWTAWGRLLECVRTGKPAWALDAEASSNSRHFDVMDNDPAAAAVFHQAMAELTRGVAPGIVGAVDWQGSRRVVDVGGGYGALLCAILEANPEMEGAVFDLGHAREGALALFRARGVASRAGYIAGTFFETLPPPADVYVLKSVIHDWADEPSLRTLARCREAMRADTRLLLVEVPAASERTGTFLDWILTFSDLNMLVNTGGRERTVAEYQSLLEAAGLRVTAIRETPNVFRVFETVRA